MADYKECQHQEAALQIDSAKLVLVTLSKNQLINNVHRKVNSPILTFFIYVWYFGQFTSLNPRRNFDGHSMRREWERVHGDSLIRMEQRPIITCDNKMDKDEDGQLSQLVACTNSWSSPKRKENIRWDWLVEPAWIETPRIFKVLCIVMCSICCPQHLNEIHTHKKKKGLIHLENIINIFTLFCFLGKRHSHCFMISSTKRRAKGKGL